MEKGGKINSFTLVPRKIGLSPVDCVLSENEYMGFDEFPYNDLTLEKGKPIQLILELPTS